MSTNLGSSSQTQLASSLPFAPSPFYATFEFIVCLKIHCVRQESLWTAEENGGWEFLPTLKLKRTGIRENANGRDSFAPHIHCNGVNKYGLCSGYLTKNASRKTNIRKKPRNRLHADCIIQPQLFFACTFENRSTSLSTPIYFSQGKSVSHMQSLTDYCNCNGCACSYACQSTYVLYVSAKAKTGKGIKSSTSRILHLQRRCATQSWLRDFDLQPYSCKITREVVTCQPWIGYRSGKVRRPKTDLLTTWGMLSITYSNMCAKVSLTGVCLRCVGTARGNVNIQISSTVH